METVYCWIDWEFGFPLGRVTSLPGTVVGGCPMHSKASHLAMLICEYQGTLASPFLCRANRQIKETCMFSHSRSAPHHWLLQSEALSHFSLKHSGNRKC